jgi:hypothetical protein
MALTFRSKLVTDQRFSPKVAGARTRLEQKLAALGCNPALVVYGATLDQFLQPLGESHCRSAIPIIS